MDIHEAWKKALSETEIIRSRIQALMTFSDTQVPYILLSESSINLGDTVVRKGRVTVQKPSIILPPNMPKFEGFEFEQDKDNAEMINFLLMRGVSLPSLRYNNKTYALDIHEGKLSDAIKLYEDQLQRSEDTHTGLLIGPEEIWQFSLLIFLMTQMMKNADSDIRKLMEKFKEDQP